MSSEFVRQVVDAQTAAVTAASQAPLGPFDSCVKPHHMENGFVVVVVNGFLCRTRDSRVSYIIFECDVFPFFAAFHV